MSICTLNDVSFYNTEQYGIPTISRVGVKDPETMRFLDPVSNQKRQLFSEVDQKGKDIITLKADLGYFYTLAYALEKVATTKIKLLTELDEKMRRKQISQQLKRKILKKYMMLSRSSKLIIIPTMICIRQLMPYSLPLIIQVN